MNTDDRTIGDWVGQYAAPAIVLFVIAAVGASVAPMFVRASTPTRKSTCQSNLKECAIALQCYWNDYDSYLPSSALAKHSKKWNKADFEVFAAGSRELPPRKQPVTWAQVLYNFMKNKDIMHCPSDSAVAKGAVIPVSYWWKLAIDKAWYGVGCKKPCRKEADFAYNADQIVLYERADFHSQPPQALRNGVMINVVYLDTHVRMVTIQNSANTWVTSPVAPGEPMYFNFDNNQPRSSSNPPPPNVRPTHTDPSRYSDSLP